MLYVILGYCVVGLKVAFGLGFVIFVHELGHFAVAKFCGVKCEKFYLGFDIAGLKFCKFRWGETEYGIGILPLGGYVKMLGQEDNPARLREELERAKQQEGAGSGSNAATMAVAKPQAQNPPAYDPRSFLAKNVPQRMAIIAAGVIMNMIFAFLMAVVAFSIGVEQIPCIVGAVFPGDPAWQADLRAGDRILKIDNKEMVQFRDLQMAISLGDIDPEQGVPILVERPGVKEPFTVTVKPDCTRGASLIGVANGKTNYLLKNKKTWIVQKRSPVTSDSPAARAEPAFQNGDKVVQIDDTPIDSYGKINEEFARKADKNITVVVERGLTDTDGKPIKGTRRVTIPVAHNPMRTLGAVMQMGPITAIQVGSPAAEAKLQPGDVIVQVDGRPVDDPMTLPSQLARRAGETVSLAIERKGAKSPEVVQVKLRKPMSYLPDYTLLDSPVEASALGVTYRVLNKVVRVIEGGPAAKAGLAADDVIVKAKLIPADKESLKQLDADQGELQIPFDDASNRNWPSLYSALQTWVHGTTVELTFSRGDKEQTVTLEPVDATDWFSADRGLVFEPMLFAHQPKNLPDALALGARETLDNTTIVFRSLRALVTAKVSPKNLVGPKGILELAMSSADQGNSRLLLFLTMLSANLAVINFMPVPLLDGGLMMFLLYEGIVGKPANERVQVVLTYVGLVLIIALMVWTLGLDFGAISRR